MSRTLRALTLAAVLVFALGLAAAPAEASFTAVAVPFCGKEVYGFGSTAAEAAANAIAAAREDYFVFNYTTLESHCDTTTIPDPTILDPFHTTTCTICWVELNVCGIRKGVVIQ